MQKSPFVLSKPGVFRQRWMPVCAAAAMLAFASPGRAEPEPAHNVVRFATTATQELTQDLLTITLQAGSSTNGTLTPEMACEVFSLSEIDGVAAATDGVWSATANWKYNPDYWAMGMNGAMFQMIAHGITSAGMFFCVGVIYDRAHHRNLDNFRGLYEPMPLYGGMAAIAVVAVVANVLAGCTSALPPSSSPTARDSWCVMRVRRR